MLWGVRVGDEVIGFRTGEQLAQGGRRLTFAEPNIRLLGIADRKTDLYSVAVKYVRT